MTMFEITIAHGQKPEQKFNVESLLSNESNWYCALPQAAKRPSIRTINEAVATGGIYIARYSDVSLTVKKVAE